MRSGFQLLSFWRQVAISIASVLLVLTSFMIYFARNSLVTLILSSPIIIFIFLFFILMTRGKTGRFVAILFIVFCIERSIHFFLPPWISVPCKLEIQPNQQISIEEKFSAFQWLEAPRQLRINFHSQSGIKIVDIETEISNFDNCQNYLFYFVVLNNSTNEHKYTLGIDCRNYSNYSTKDLKIKEPKDVNDFEVVVDLTNLEQYNPWNKIGDDCKIQTKIYPPKSEWDQLFSEGSAQSDLDKTPTYYFRKKNCIDQSFKFQNARLLGELVIDRANNSCKVVKDF